VKRIHRGPGERVIAGEPLIEIQPDPTPLELADAKRRVEMDEIANSNAEKRLNRARELLSKALVSDKDFEDADRDGKQAALQLDMSRERLALIEKGHVSIAGMEIDAIVKSPINGFILEKNINIGDPVVPLTSYQEGTALMTMADMGKLVFKGTVDEVDVGKLNAGQPVRFTVGAIPDKEVSGILRKISPKARKQEAATIFDVEADLVPVKEGPVLRAGYSTTARIAIARADSVLVVPERCVKYEGTDATVGLSGKDGKPVDKKITTGLSAGLTVEVKDGLVAGDKVLEPATAKPGKK
jgi:HlyD family secretion protein